jgi:hypothetical protein
MPARTLGSIDFILAQYSLLAYSIGYLIACCTLGRAILGTIAQSTLSKSSPKRASVLALGQSLIRIDDGVTSLYKVRIAWLSVMRLLEHLR